MSRRRRKQRGKRRVYHLALDEEGIQGAEVALLPGDPGRVPRIAQGFDPEARELAFHREYRSFLGHFHGKPVLVVSTGIGGPSTSIAVEELAQLGVEIFVRVGTCGGIAPHIRVGDVVIASGTVRLDGASVQYAPIEYPAVAHYEVLNALVGAARSLQKRFHVGILASTATFYPGQERKDSFLGCVPRALRGSLAEWRTLNVLAYEMEAATLFTMASAFGLRAGCVTGVVVHRERSERVTEGGLKQGEQNAIAVAVAALEALVRL